VSSLSIEVVAQTAAVAICGPFPSQLVAQTAVFAVCGPSDTGRDGKTRTVNPAARATSG
jgi:hypothetical protein